MCPSLDARDWSFFFLKRQLSLENSCVEAAFSKRKQLKTQQKCRDFTFRRTGTGNLCVSSAESHHWTPPNLPNLVHLRMLYLYNTQAERLFLQAITDVRSTIHLLLAALSHLARTSLFFSFLLFYGDSLHFGTEGPDNLCHVNYAPSSFDFGHVSFTALVETDVF